MKPALCVFAICLAVLQGPGDDLRAAEELPPLIASRQKSFVIPFKVAPPPPGLKELPQVDLFVSIDRGETWRPYSSVKVDEKGFKFRTALDGEFCFAVKTHTPGRPAANPKLRPELRVLVDTAPPELTLTARCDETGVISALLKIVEDNLQADTVKLEFRAGDSVEAWEPVALDPIPTDLLGPTFYAQPIWRPEQQSRIYTIRAEVKDKAGNPAVAEAQVEFRPAEMEEPEIEGPALRFDRQVQNDQPRADFASNSIAAPPLPRERPAIASPPVANKLAATAAPVAWPADESAEVPGSRYRTAAKPIDRVMRLPAVDEASGSVTAWRARTGQAATEFSPAVGAKLSTQPLDEGRAADWVPPGIHPRMVNTRKFSLDYDVESVGPWGIRRVELWGTRDYGRTWISFGADDDNQSPLAAQVEEEGVYGFRVLVQSGSGLVEAPPKSGDVPEVWVRVDLTPPVCRIVGVDHGSGERAGQLIIHWDASDAMPAERPISLSFSSNPSGPWQAISSGLRNTGRYVWQLDQRTPDAVYLRLECRDEAGNVAVYQPTDPVTVAPLRPRARIREVRPYEAGQPAP
ncbi:MAG: hypothetical protein AB7O62_09985 [Pirellulales bacterium]